MINAYGIFEGGGAKGLAHAGALKAAEENDIRFVGLAGASAGAIIAALIAVGYRANELFDPDSRDPKKVFNANFVELLGKRRWKVVSALRWILRNYGKHRVAKLFFGLLGAIATVFLVVALITALFTGFNYLDTLALPIAIVLVATIVGFTLVFVVVLDLYLPMGLFSSTNFEAWLNRKLSEKLFPGEEIKLVTFADLKEKNKVPLKIIVTDIRSRKPVVIDAENNISDSVAEAVGHSLAIPFAFQPHFHKDMTFVDGGVLSNFPAWVFDDQRAEQTGVVYTLGFRLHNALDEQDVAKRKKTLKNYLFDLSTVFFGDSLLQIREIEDLYLIPIKVSATTLDFDLDHEGRRSLFHEGYYATNRFFRRFSSGTSEELVGMYLKRLHDEMDKLLKVDDLHLRLNIALPIEPQRRRMRILYTYNMDDDCDDRLELKINAGAMGKCWQTKQPVMVNMDRVRSSLEDWNMTKYEQALIRKELKTLISLPLMPAKRDNKTNVDPVAILSIDSDNDLTEQFLILGSPVESDLTNLVKSTADRIAVELTK